LEEHLEINRIGIKMLQFISSIVKMIPCGIFKSED